MNTCLKNGQFKPFKVSNLPQIGFEFHKIGEELVKTGFSFVIKPNERWETAYIRESESPIPVNSICLVTESGF